METTAKTSFFEKRVSNKSKKSKSEKSSEDLQKIPKEGMDEIEFSKSIDSEEDGKE